MEKNDPILIPIETARELTAPYELQDVLSSLYENGAIEWFIMGEQFITVQPIDDKRFDIAFLIMETIDNQSYDRTRRRPH